jgi:hypothetical protein
MKHFAMKGILKLSLLLIFLLTITGCLDDPEEPDPKPQTPPPTQQVADE